MDSMQSSPSFSCLQLCISVVRVALGLVEARSDDGLSQGITLARQE
jgi:hypothetical protein